MTVIGIYDFQLRWCCRFMCLNLTLISCRFLTFKFEYVTYVEYCERRHRESETKKKKKNVTPLLCPLIYHVDPYCQCPFKYMQPFKYLTWITFYHVYIDSFFFLLNKRLQLYTYRWSSIGRSLNAPVCIVVISFECSPL